MVKRVYPSTADFESLSRLRTEPSDEANQTDYSRVVVVKPWGYEYLWMQNPSVAVWMLHLGPGQSTSLHCHARKRTSLIVTSGEVVCSTIEDRHRLHAGQAIVLEPCVFHSTRATSPAGAFVMEVENPPLKGDLWRFRDDFGRAGRAYESASKHSTDFAAFDYQPLPAGAHGGAPFPLHDVALRLSTFHQTSQLSASFAPDSLAVPCLGRVVFGRKIVADIGQTVPAALLAPPRNTSHFPPVELLEIRPVRRS